jgi:hypothetical protein
VRQPRETAEGKPLKEAGRGENPLTRAPPGETARGKPQRTDCMPYAYTRASRAAGRRRVSDVARLVRRPCRTGLPSPPRRSSQGRSAAHPGGDAVRDLMGVGGERSRAELVDERRRSLLSSVVPSARSSARLAATFLNIVRYERRRVWLVQARDGRQQTCQNGCDERRNGDAGAQ